MAVLFDLTPNLRIGDARALSSWARRSHLPDGRCVAWTGSIANGNLLAIDAEFNENVPPALADRFGTIDFWARWTRLECVAKLTQSPVVILQQYGLDLPPLLGLSVQTETFGRIVVSVARLELGAPTKTKDMRPESPWATYEFRSELGTAR